MTGVVLPLADPRADLPTVGGKGASLARLAAAGFPVPDGFHVTTAAYRGFVRHCRLSQAIEEAVAGADPAMPESLEAAARTIRDAFIAGEMPPDLARVIGDAYEALARTAARPEEVAVAVRSSATAEDLPELSFAGQQESFLDVRGRGPVLDAVKRCWASLWTGRAIAYRTRTRIAHEDVALAVVVQLLVDAEASGVMFTADPATGRRDRLTIDAAWGLGESIVGGRVTPDVLSITKDSRRVVERTISDKAVRTARRGGRTEEEPVPESLRRAPVLDDGQAAELADIGVRIESLYGAAMDIEWARAGGRFYLLQARPITALPDEEPAPPASWDPPVPGTKWSRGSVADFMPDPLSPLFATLGLRVYGETFNAMVEDMGGCRDLYGTTYALTVNGYAYTTLTVSARAVFAILFRLMPKIIGILRNSRRFWEAERDRFKAAVAEGERRDPAAMSDGDLVRGAEDAWRAATRHLAVFQVSGMSAAMTEMLLSRLWERDKKRRRAPNDPPASAMLLGFESEPIRADISLWDLTETARSSGTLSAWLLEVPEKAAAEAIASDTRPENVAEEEWTDFCGAFLAHVDAYGRAILTLDFASPTPSESPSTYLATMKHWLAGRGTDPRARQAAASARREALAATARGRARSPRGWLFRKILAWAQSSAPLREDCIATIGYGTPLVRRLLLELGRRLVAAGSLRDPSDVFWLEETELRECAAILDGGGVVASHVERVRQRKALWRSRKRVIPPSTIPLMKKFMGFTIANFLADSAAGERGMLKGFPASGGKAVAPARVVRGPEDFARMRAGEALVAAITTPAWTPLFAMAAAVVTDTGGPLSHGSIVAREYGIPAVLGTGTATRRVRDGDLLAVDGDAGTVRWEEPADLATAGAPIDGSKGSTP